MISVFSVFGMRKYSNYISYMYCSRDPYHPYVIKLLKELENKTKLNIITLDSDLIDNTYKKHKLKKTPKIMIVKNNKVIKTFKNLNELTISNLEKNL